MMISDCGAEGFRQSNFFAQIVRNFPVIKPEDFDRMCLGLDIPRIELPMVNVTKHKHYREYYTPELRDLVGEQFKEDVERFRYEF